MTAPKMGNSYPGSLSSYPSWVAHETPYTAEWGNSVGYEFYLIEYELGVAPRGTYNSLKERLDANPNYTGFNYWAKGYYLYPIVTTTVANHPVYFDVVEHDSDLIFDLVGRRNITAPVSGWYNVKWRVDVDCGSGTYPCELKLYVESDMPGPNKFVGIHRLVLERAGNYTLMVDATKYLSAGSYVFAYYHCDEEVQIQNESGSGNNEVQIRLIDAAPYERR